MKIAKYSKLIKEHATLEAAEGWKRSKDPEGFCVSILHLENEHPVIQQIVAGALNNILSYRAGR